MSSHHLGVLRADIASFIAAVVFVLSSVVTGLFTYFLQRRWRTFKSVPFLSDATYDTREHPIFTLFVTIAASTLLATVLLARLVQCRPTEAVESGSTCCLSYSWICNAGMVAGTAGCVVLAVASAISAKSESHWWVVLLSFCMFI